jgi:protein TonB
MRNTIIAAICSLCFHAGLALSGKLMVPDPEDPSPAVAQVPTIEIELPPAPEPEEPEMIESTDLPDIPSDISDIAPPMQQDVPTATFDSPFVQTLQRVPPPSLGRPSLGNVIPTDTRPTVAPTSNIGNLFDLAVLDRRPVPTFQPAPQYPFEMRRAGIRGEVLVRFIVDSNGNVRDPIIIRSSNAAFEEPVIQAVLRWRFRPGQKGGVNVNTGNVQVLIPFTLES